MSAAGMLLLTFIMGYVAGLVVGSSRKDWFSKMRAKVDAMRCTDDTRR